MKLAYHMIVAGTNEPLAELIPVLAEAGIEAIEAHSATIRWFEPDLQGQGNINSEDLARLIGEDSDYHRAVVLEAHRPEGMSLADLHEKMFEFVLA